MRLAGVRTVLHITEVNETERELLKRLGFQDLQETDMADNELWEYCTDFNVSKKIDYQQIGENLIIASDGKIFLRMENGFYIDRNRNEYRFTAGTLIPVLIRNAQPAYPEITEAEYHDELGKEKSDRYAVADFVGTWISEVYSNGQSRSMDAAVSGKTSEYPLYCMRQHLDK